MDTQNQINSARTTAEEGSKKMGTEFFNGKAFRVEILDTLAIINFDLSGERINKWDENSLNELDRVLSQLEANKGSLSAVLFRSSKNKSYIVGADIKVIQGLKSVEHAVMASELGQKVFSRFEDFPLPTIAAIEGPCMGGGTEFSLSCDYRVASDSEKTQIALPEVKLGIIPGWGGNYRMTRLVELPTALDLILSGKALNASKAKRAGLVDEVFPEGLFVQKSLEFAKSVKKKRAYGQIQSSSFANKVLTSNFLGRNLIFKKTKETILINSRGHYPAPLKALELIQSMWGRKRNDWMKKEQEFFAQLAVSDISKNLVSIFFMNEAVKKDTGSDLSFEEASKLPQINQLAVLGAGVMGGGIAAQSASKGLWVFLKDMNFQAVGNGIEQARKIYKKLVDRKKWTITDMNDKIRHIRGQTDYSGFKGLDLVIEAVVEDLEVKKKVFADLEKVTSADCILATNTSSLKLADISTALEKPERFLGLHFFNPVDKMPLVEVVVTDKTPRETTARAVAYVKNIGKTPLVTKDGPGFLVNRLLVPFLLEAACVFEEGADPEKIDSEIKKFGMPMGPYELLDEIGIDVVSKICPVFEKALGERFKAPQLYYKMAADVKDGKKRLGKKSGLGFYVWKDGKRQGIDRESLQALTGVDLSGQKFLQSGDTLSNRMIFPMINEAAAVLAEGIVPSADKVDLGMIFGLGFPPFRGGLCRYADSIGLDKIVKELERFTAVYGQRFKPSDALKNLAANGGKFYS